MGREGTGQDRTGQNPSPWPNMNHSCSRSRLDGSGRDRTGLEEAGRNGTERDGT